MFWQSYIMDLLAFPACVIGLILALSIFIDRIIGVRNLSKKKRIKSKSTIMVLLLGLAIIQLIIGLIGGSFKYSSIRDTAPLLLTISLALMAYNFNYIMEGGLFLNGKIIRWSDIKSWQWKDGAEKFIYLEYCKKEKNNNIMFSIGDSEKKEFAKLLNSRIKMKKTLETKKQFNRGRAIKWSLSIILILLIISTSYMKVIPRDINKVLGSILDSNKYLSVNIIEKSYENNDIEEKVATLDWKEGIEQVINNMDILQIRKLPFNISETRFRPNTLDVKFIAQNNEEVNIRAYEDTRTLKITQGNKVEYYWVEDINFTKRMLLKDPMQSKLQYFEH